MQPYFAQLPQYSKALGSRLVELVNRWYQDLPSLRPYQRAKRHRQMYYGLPSSASPFDVSTVAQMGDQGELSAIHVNRFHHLGQRILTMAVQDDFGWQPVAANADTLSTEESILAASVLEYEKRAQRLTALRTRIMESALIDAWTHYAVRWDPGGGKKYDTDPETKADIYEGRLLVTQHPWWRVTVDTYRDNPDHEWCILTEFDNRWELAERHGKGVPEVYRRIVSLPPENQCVLTWQQQARGFTWSPDSNSRIPVYTFFHKPSRAVPDGRIVVFTGDGSILSDTGSVYGDGIPVHRTSAGEMLDTPFGSTAMADIGALQQVLNMLVSTAVTNNAAHGVPNVAIRSGANLSRSQLDGMNLWEVEGDPKSDIASINLVDTSPETYNLAEIVKEEMSTLVGLNAVSLGQQTQQMSGALAALLDSKSQQFASLFIAQDRQTVADMGTAILDCDKRFAQAPRALEVIAGSGRAYMLENFVGAKINGVSRVTVEVRSGLMSTTSGKLDFVEKLVAAGDNPELRRHLYAVYKSGNLDSAMLPEETEDMLVKQENDLIARGITPPVRVTDPHAEHIRRHREPLANPNARTDESVARAHDEHVQGHIDALKNTDLELLMLMGQQPMGLPPPGAPGEPPPGPPPVGAPGEMPDMGAGLEIPEAELPNQPGMPNLPTTGETYLPPGPPSLPQ